MARHNDVGKVGEDIAAEYLHKAGWSLIERNYRRKYGEIDIVARLPGRGLPGQGETGREVVFVEVKTLSRETSYRPEENIHPQKLRRLSRTIQAYVLSHRVQDWRFDVIAVYLNFETRRAKIRHVKNVIIGA